MLTATTAMTLSHDSGVRRARCRSRAGDRCRSERLWLERAVGNRASCEERAGRVGRMGQVEQFCGQTCSSHRRGERDRPLGRAESGAPGRRALSHRPRCRGPGHHRRRRPARWAHRCSRTGALDISRLRRGLGVRRRYPLRARRDGHRDEHRRDLGLGHRVHTRPTNTGSRWSTST